MVSDNSLAERPSPSTNLAEVDFITALVERPTHDEGVMPQRRLKEGLYRDPQYRKTYVPESSTQDHKAAPEEASLNHEDRHLLLENSDKVRADKRKVAASTPQTLGHLSEEGVWVATLEHHQKMLIEDSGITSGVVEARGYRTILSKAELERLGFGRNQRNPPGLLIPIYSPSGDIANYQFRPDSPRIKDGKPVKYETPSGSSMAFDVHPFARETLGDPSVPLVVTEGIKKGDALVSRGLCAVTLLGVWNWRGRNEDGGKVALSEWELLALNDRLVYVVFDSDVMLKPGVHQALGRLKGFLESRGAEVALTYLPPGTGGTKQGVDDFFVAGHGVEDLLSLATTELKELSVGDDGTDMPDTQSAFLVRYAIEADLFHTPDGEAYATFPVEDPNAS